MTKKTDENNNNFYLNEDGVLIISDEALLNDLGGAANDGTMTYDGIKMHNNAEAQWACGNCGCGCNCNC